MTITLSQQAFDELFQETVERSQHPDPDDVLDVVYKYPRRLGQGYWRVIQLRQGLELIIGNLQMRDRMITTHPEQENDWLEYHFHFSGEHYDKYRTVGAGEYSFVGSGLDPKQTSDCSDKNSFLEVNILMQAESLYSFAANQDGQLPQALQPWIRQSHQTYYCRCGTATPAMQTAARQILKCPYQGIAKRLYLEGKALELMGMLVAQEIEINDGNKLHTLKPDVVERIYHARDILLKRLSNPPSFMELSRAVGLNDYLLKQGFRQVFGTTAFSYLHDYRLEQARQLLVNGDMRVSEIANIVGFISHSYFTTAFRKKFGFCPKEYQMQQKKSL
ncbi:helix-turn-helix transcriptional regulator [Hassallia byssoidea VB512170]|uniref:Helix-turn-helix transcriptional regulator n=1 Tax=Hassallia byssoidea VB512170 TaxID=1304833 RepID=A0A846HFN0_9CYAN|nr:AraC family transcriptional regulator [Hassalia byssoidea]NEU76146.1 helix-turn-helix transcriptional regulator [Hassalia byssoidea VB512170]